MGRALILTAVALIVLALFVRHKEAALQTDGVVAAATVIGAGENRAVVVIGGVAMPAPAYEITVGFVDKTGRSQTKTFTTPKKMYASGDTVRVIYDQEKPMLAKLLTSDNEVPEWDRTSTFLFALAALAVVMAVANRLPG